jgi:hypothetical protein
MIEIINADRGMISYVLDNLRQADREEMEACETDLAMLPRAIMHRRTFAYAACDIQYGPVAVWGMVHRRHGVGAGFAFGTEDWGLALLPMLRQIRHFVLPFLIDNGFHRVEAVAMAHRRDVARFMSIIGAQPEGVLREYGINGEDFVSYRWLADEHDGTAEAADRILHATH